MIKVGDIVTITATNSRHLGKIGHVTGIQNGPWPYIVYFGKQDYTVQIGTYAENEVEKVITSEGDE